MTCAKSQDFNRSEASLPDCIDSQVGGHKDGLQLQSSSGEEIFRGFVSLSFCLFKQLRPGHDRELDGRPLRGLWCKIPLQPWLSDVFWSAGLVISFVLGSKENLHQSRWWGRQEWKGDEGKRERGDTFSPGNLGGLITACWSSNCFRIF